MLTVCGFVLRKSSARSMRGSLLRRCREDSVWTLVSAACSLHFTVAPLVADYAVWSGFSSCAYVDDCPGASFTKAFRTYFCPKNVLGHL